MPKNYPKKKFFREPTKAEIKKLELISICSNFIECIENLEQGQGLIIERRLIPEEKTQREVKKHGQEIPIPIGIINQTPFELRRYALNNLENGTHFYLTHKPQNIIHRGKIIEPTDKRKRMITPYEGIQASKIIYRSFHTYPKQQEDCCFIIVKPYDTAERAGIDGIEAVCEVPSRTINTRPYRFRLTSVPIKDNKNKTKLASRIGSTHMCDEKLYFFGYSRLEDIEPYDVFYFCAHEIAAYWKLAKFYMKESGKNNIVPLEMSPFLFPTQRGINLYKNIRNKTLIRDENIAEKDKLRTLNIPEINALFFEAARKYGHDPFFFNRGESADIGDERLQYCNWAL